MLISYPLLIFALTASVAALSPSPESAQPQQAFDSKPVLWETLEGNTDQRLVKDKDPTDPQNRRVYRWYRLKIVNTLEDYPTWPEDDELDDVMRFPPTKHGIKIVSYLRLNRDRNHDRQSGTIYIARRKGAFLDHAIIPLVGYWGRASELNDLREGKVSPVVDYDEIMEITNIGGKRCVRFLEDTEKSLHFFSPALTAYSIQHPWQTLEGNTYLPRLQEGPHPVEWYRLKMVKSISTDYPIWSRDRNLDDVMKFVPINGRIENVFYFTLPRVTQDQHHYLLCNTEYSPQTNGPVNDWSIPLEGFWGRANGLATFSDGGAHQVVFFDKVIEIRKFGPERGIRFLEHEDWKLHFSPALTVYESIPPPQQASGSEPDPWQELEGNRYLSRLQEDVDPDHPVRYWYRLKIVEDYSKDYPTWPKDAELDHVMQFITNDGIVTRVTYFKLERVESGDRLRLGDRFSPHRTGSNKHLNDPRIPLDGFWGRANNFNTGMGQVISFDKVIQIRRQGMENRRKIQFFERIPYAFCPALLEYTLPKRKPKRGREVQGTGEPATKHKKPNFRPGQYS